VIPWLILHYFVSIIILDDSALGECVSVRSLSHIHEDGIISSAYSYNASLIATLTSDSNMQLWDFETLQLQAVCSIPSGDMHIVEFLDPFPVVIAADNLGNLLFFATSPQYSCNVGGCLHAFCNTLEVNAFDSQTISLSPNDGNQPKLPIMSGKI